VPYPRQAEEDCFWAAQASALSLGQLEGWSLDSAGGLGGGDGGMGMEGLHWAPSKEGASERIEAQIEDEVMASFGLGRGEDRRGMGSVREEDEGLVEFVAGNLF